MSALDQAFIKAFEKKHAATGSAAPKRADASTPIASWKDADSDSFHRLETTSPTDTGVPHITFEAADLPASMPTDEVVPPAIENVDPPAKTVAGQTPVIDIAASETCSDIECEQPLAIESEPPTETQSAERVDEQPSAATLEQLDAQEIETLQGTVASEAPVAALPETEVTSDEIKAAASDDEATAVDETAAVAVVTEADDQNATDAEDLSETAELELVETSPIEAHDTAKDAIEQEAPAQPSEAAPEISKPGEVEAVEETETKPADEPPQEDAPAKTPVAQPLQVQTIEVDELPWDRVSSELLEVEGPAFESAGASLLELVQAGQDVIYVTGIDRVEGRTTLVGCLSRWAARNGANVAVVDCDAKNPRLSTMLTPDVENDTKRIAAVVSNSENITFLSLANRRAEEGEPKTSAILSQLADEFDLVLVDLGMLSRVDLEQLTQGDSSRQAAVLVRDLRCSNYRMVLEAREQLKSAGIDPVCIADNFRRYETVEEPLTATA